MNTQTLAANGERLDVLLTKAGITRSRAAQLIREGCVFVEGSAQTKPSARPRAGDTVTLVLPDTRETETAPQNIPIHIFYEDSHLAVVEKPCGMVVHPAAGNPDGTLVNALLFHLDHLSGIGGEKRPGIVHRLDKDTSGLLLVAKNDAAHTALSAQLSARQMEKHYLAWVAGVMKEPSGVIDAPIARSKNDRKRMAVDPEGRSALTKWTVILQEDDRALLNVHIVTGRTHQIRVHMASIHHPVLGDSLYGFKNMPHAKRLMLHAYTLSFTHPFTGERLTFRSEPEACFRYPAGKPQTGETAED